MGKKNYLDQFTGAFVRQMGREFAHSAYKDATEKNIKEHRESGKTKPYHSYPFLNYGKLLLAQIFLPVIGSIWAIVRGIKRHSSEKMLVYNIVYEDSYRVDRRYSDGKRYIETEETIVKETRFKTDMPPEEVKRYHAHAKAYIIIGVISLIIGYHIAENAEISNSEETAELSSYTKWQTIDITDDFTEKTITYHMIYPTVDSTVTKKMILMKKNGNYILLSTSSSNFEYNKSIDIKTSNGVKTIEAKSLEPAEYLTPQNKTVYFPICLEIPKNLVPSKGQMKIRSKGIIYTFDLN